MYEGCLTIAILLPHLLGLRYAYNTVKPVLSDHSKIDKTKVLKTNGGLMKVKSIAECSLGAFCNTFDLHYAMIGLTKTCFGLLFEWPLKTGFYCT